MTNAQNDESTPRRPLRLWPGVVAVVLQWLAMFVLPVVVPEAQTYGMLAGLFLGLVVVVWWLLFSRALWFDRLGAIVVMMAGLAGTSRILHVSIAKGAMGMLFFLLVIPVLSLTFVAWAAASRRLADGPRRLTMVLTILISCLGWALVRTGGFTGGLKHDLAWRWSPTPEELLLAKAGDEPIVAAVPTAAATPKELLPVTTGDEAMVAPVTPAGVSTPKEKLADHNDTSPAASAPAPSASPTPAQTVSAATATWPGFRGPQRDGNVAGVRIATDWSKSPPVELWRRPIGPGWSSFAVDGDRLYTQEQRGDDELVACYSLTTGEPVWQHRDAARFWESNGGAGPRGTPTLSNGRVYSLGGTGIVNALNAADGTLVWSRNAATDTGAKLPGWGFSSSPLVVDEVVIVAASGALVAYATAAGEPRWHGPVGGAGYSSPQLVTIDGVIQILQLNGAGLVSVLPVDGSLLWEHAWSGYPIVQPAMTADGDILLSVDADSGTRRIAVTRGPAGWTVKERWTSIRLKPYFNDFVVHDGHAFGFDGTMLACMDVADGKRKWKGGRYGRGQLVLLAEQHVLLVLSEQGELALVAAAADQFTELARFAAINGKTWNHPVLVGDVLLVRNAEEMAAFRLSVAGS